MRGMSQASAMGGSSINIEEYVGMVIDGLPTEITDFNDKIHDLDENVLSEFAVRHIEVVESALRITFHTPITDDDIASIRKNLKHFLLNICQLEKKMIRKITIAPHTIQTWKGKL